MSLNGLVQPPRIKCQDLNWSMIRAQQLSPSGMDPRYEIRPQCDYGTIAPYMDPNVVHTVELANSLRGAPTSMCGKQAPRLYFLPAKGLQK